MRATFVTTTCLLALFGLAEVGLRAAGALQDRAVPLRADTAEAVVVLGDSVSFGHGLRPEEAWPARLQDRLHASGHADVQVVNHARGGLTVGALERPGRRVVEDVARRGMRPIVLVMLGHNDFLRWEGRPDNPFAERLRGGADAGRPGPRLRLARLFRWLVEAARGTPPTVRIDPAARAHLAAGLADLTARVRPHGGGLAVLTYPVPGPPPSGMDPKRAVWVAASRDAQRAGNAALRAEAAAQGLPLIDLERALPPGLTWSPDRMLDHIHPTAALADEVAAEVAGAMEQGL